MPRSEGGIRLAVGSRRPVFWRIWAEREDEDDEFEEYWYLGDRVIKWLDEHCEGWGSIIVPESPRAKFIMGFPSHLQGVHFYSHWHRKPPPKLIDKIGFEPERYLTLPEHDKLLDYIGSLEREVEELRDKLAKRG